MLAFILYIAHYNKYVINVSSILYAVQLKKIYSKNHI